MVEQGGYQRKLEWIEWGKDTSGGISLRQERKIFFFLRKEGSKDGVDSDYQDSYIIFLLPIEIENLGHPK